MKVKIKQKKMNAQVTERLCGGGWEFEVTGRPAWVRRMIAEYVPKIQAIVRQIEQRQGRTLRCSR
jgi:hypothetical protein